MKIRKFSKIALIIALLFVIILMLASCRNEESQENQQITAAVVEPANVGDVVPDVPQILTEPEPETQIIPTTVIVEVEIEEPTTEETDKSADLPVKVLVLSEPINPAESTEPEQSEQSAEPKKNAAIKFPVFMYHTSSENNPGDFSDLYVKPSEFEKQLKYLIENNYTLCTFDDWNNLYNIEKPVFITFDDGYIENYTEIFPILQKYNVKITVFLVVSPDLVRMPPDIIREMSDSGLVKFESHTMTHAKLAGISSDESKLTEELRESKIKIEEWTGKPVVAISYPEGNYNSKVIEETKKYYKFAVNTVYGLHNTDRSDFEIRRIGIGRYDTLNDFIRFLR